MNYVWDAFWILFMLGSVVAFFVVTMKDKASRKKAALATGAGAPAVAEATSVADDGQGLGDFPADPMNFDDFK